MSTPPINPKQLQSLIDLFKLFNEKIEKLPENFAEDLIDNLKISNKQIKKTNDELVKINKKLLGLTDTETAKTSNKDLSSVNTSIENHSKNIVDAIKETNRIISDLSSNILKAPATVTQSLDPKTIKSIVAEAIKSTNKKVSAKNYSVENTTILIKSINRQMTSFGRALTKVITSIESIDLKPTKRTKKKEEQDQPIENMGIVGNSLNLTNAKIQKILTIDKFDDLQKQVSGEIARFSNLKGAIHSQIKNIENKLLDPSLDKREQEEALKEKIELHKQYQQQLHLISDLISTSILQNKDNADSENMMKLVASQKAEIASTRQEIIDTTKKLENITGNIEKYHMDYAQIISNTINDPKLIRKAMDELYKESRKNLAEIHEEQQRIILDIHSSEQERADKLLTQQKKEQEEETRLAKLIDERYRVENRILQDKKLEAAIKYEDEQLNKVPGTDPNSPEYIEHMSNMEKHLEKMLKETLIEKISRKKRDIRDWTRFNWEMTQKKANKLNQRIKTASGGKYNIGSLLTTLTGSGGLISKLIEMYGTFKLIFNTIKPFLTVASVIVSSLVALLVVALLKVKPVWKLLYGIFWLLGKVAGTLYWLITNIITSIFDKFQKIGIFFENLLGGIYMIFNGEVGKGIKQILNSAWELFKMHIPILALFDDIKSIFNKSIDDIKGIWNKFSSIITDSKLYKLIFSGKESTPNTQSSPSTVPQIETDSLYEGTNSQIKRLEENRKNLEEKKIQQKETQQNSQSSISNDVMLKIAKNIEQTNSLLENQKQPVPTQPVPVPANITIDYNRPPIWQST